VSDEKAISTGSRVSLFFELALENGEVIDSTFDHASPATLEMGDGSLLPGFESCLLGMRAGEEREFILDPLQAFGEPNPESIHSLDRKQFSGVEARGELQVGAVVSFSGAGKQPMPGIVRELGGDSVTVDFNHPLAGKRIRFRVRVAGIE
jgi:FKBP-type peptidyl-prolyl cis-trans isomerase SlpA